MEIDELVRCGGATFQTAALRTGPPAEFGDDPAAQELRNLIDQQRDWDDPHAIGDGDWRVLSRSDGEAVFGRGSPPRPSVVIAGRSESGQWFTRTGGPCWARRVVDGLEAVYWAPDPADPDPTSQQVHVLVEETACAGGRPPDGRVRTEATERSDAVVITATVVPLEGDRTCPDGPPAEVVVDLDQPVGSRVLLDGGAVPPQPPCLPDNLFEGCP